MLYIINNGRIRPFNNYWVCLLLRFSLSSVKLILLVALFITVLDNQVFFGKITERLDILSLQGAGYTLTIFAIIFLVLVLIQFLFGVKYLLKPVMIFLLLVSAVLSYFSQQLGVIFDVDMIRNVVETIKDNNQQEATELLSLPLILHVLFYGVLPSVFVAVVNIRYKPLFKEIFSRVFYLVGIIAVVAALILMNFKYTTYFSRENRDLRYFITPIYAMDSLKGYIRRELKNKNVPLKIIGGDAVQTKSNAQRVIGVMVVGETARGDHFSLNGYERETNPILKKEGVLNFSQTSSCGTSTAFSVPCMFSFLDRGDYSPEKASQQWNALDVLVKAGVKVYWLDNNSSCKGVCERTGEVNMRNKPDPESPYFSKGELFDEALIAKMGSVLEENKAETGDVLFVLHTLGSHGPKYYKRYPDKFSKFEPACKKDTPQECTDQENINAYDNTILYTDFVLGKIIEFLKTKQAEDATFMVYASDHGESLGEKGVYLHGLPYFLAPSAQTHVPMLGWFSEHYLSHMKPESKAKNHQSKSEVSHDNLSHSLLGAFGVKANVYKKDYDLFQ